MSLTILLDTGPLGLVTNPKPSPQSLDCGQWLQAMIGQGCRVIATTNVGHLSRYCSADLWQNI